VLLTKAQKRFWRIVRHRRAAELDGGGDASRFAYSSRVMSLAAIANRFPVPDREATSATAGAGVVVEAIAHLR